MQWLVSDVNFTKQELWIMQEGKSDVASKLVENALKSLMANDSTGKKVFKVLPEPRSLSVTLSDSFNDSMSSLYSEFRRKEGVCGSDSKNLSLIFAFDEARFLVEDVMDYGKSGTSNSFRLVRKMLRCFRSACLEFFAVFTDGNSNLANFMPQESTARAQVQSSCSHHYFNRTLWTRR